MPIIEIRFPFSRVCTRRYRIALIVRIYPFDVRRWFGISKQANFIRASRRRNSNRRIAVGLYWYNTLLCPREKNNSVTRPFLVHLSCEFITVTIFVLFKDSLFFALSLSVIDDSRAMFATLCATNCDIFQFSELIFLFHSHRCSYLL